MNGTPPCKTNVGVRVIRGRLPGATTFGLFASVKADCRRWPIKTPVSPATTAGSHAPLGVALNKLPVSVAFPSVAASYAVVAVIAHLLWNEPLGWPQFAGILLIGGGILLIHQH